MSIEQRIHERFTSKGNRPPWHWRMLGYTEDVLVWLLHNIYVTGRVVREWYCAWNCRCSHCDLGAPRIELLEDPVYHRPDCTWRWESPAWHDYVKSPW